MISKPMPADGCFADTALCEDATSGTTIESVPWEAAPQRRCVFDAVKRPRFDAASFWAQRRAIVGTGGRT